MADKHSAKNIGVKKSSGRPSLAKAFPKNIKHVKGKQLGCGHKGK